MEGNMKKIQFLIVFLSILTLFGCQQSESKIIDEVISEFNLPASVDASIDLPNKVVHDELDVSIEWISSHPSVIDITGNVSRTNEDIEVTLTAKFTLGSIVKEKTYKILVLALGSDTIVIRTYAHPNEVFKTYYQEKLSNLPILETPTHPSATFISWCIDSDLEIIIPDSIVLDKNLDLYAKWDVEYYDVTLIYSGFKNFTKEQSLHLQQLNILDSYIEEPEDTNIVSMQLLSFDERGFNIHQVKQVIHIETVEDKYSISYYQKEEDPVLFEQIFVEQYDNNMINQYGLTFDNHLFSIVQNGIETRQIDLGIIDLDEQETIVEISTSYLSVFVATSLNKVHAIQNLFNMGGYQDTEIITIDLNKYQLGNFIEFNVSTREMFAIVAVCEKGIIDLTDPYRLPYVFIIEDETDTIKEVLFKQQDYYILTEKNQVYLARSIFIKPNSAYGNITEQISLEDEEFVVDFLMINMYVYFVTSHHRAIHYATYGSDQTSEVIYGIQGTYSLGISSNERIEWIQGNIIYTNIHQLYSIVLENGLSSPIIQGVTSLNLPLLQDEYVVSYFIDNIHDQLKPNIFITNLNHMIVYDTFNREYQRIESVTLKDDEKILFYLIDLQETSYFRILTSDQLYVGYDFAVDESITQSVMNDLGVTELFDLIIYEDNRYRASTYDGLQYNKYDYFTIEMGSYSIWKITDHLILSKNETVPQPIVFDPLIHKTWSLQHASIETVPEIVTQDINLYLVENPHAYILNFDTQTEQEISSMQIEKNTSYQLPIPVELGKYFLGWYLDFDLKNMFQPDKIAYGKTYTLYASWTNDTYHIYYHNVDTNILPSEIATGTKPIITSEIPVKTGYQFVGWYDENNVRFRDEEARFEDLHLYAKFNPIQLNIELIDESEQMYYATAYYDQTLRDIQTFMYGYVINEFYLDSRGEQLLDLDYILENDQTLYITLVEKDVSIILLEELIITGDVNYFFIGNVLFAEYNSHIYMYKSGEHQELNGESYYIDQPIDITELLNINIEEVTGVHSINEYVLFFINEDEVRILDCNKREVVQTINLHLSAEEILDLKTIISFRIVQGEFYYFMGLSSYQRLFIFDLNGNITVINHVTELIENIRFVVAVTNNMPVAYYFNNEGVLETRNLYQDAMYIPEGNPILRVINRTIYQEIFENGQTLLFNYRQQDSENPFIVTENYLNLETDETIIKVENELIFTSLGRVLSFSNSSGLSIIDIRDRLSNDELIINIGYDRGSEYVITSNNRVIFTNGRQEIFELSNDEIFLTVYENMIITDKHIYIFDWQSNTWVSYDVLLDGETLVKIENSYIYTSLNRLLNLTFINIQRPVIITFKLYRIKEILIAPYNSEPLLPDYGNDNFMGWYHDSWLLIPFETVNSSGPIVLYPKVQ